MTPSDSPPNAQAAVDVVVPVFSEDPEAIEATVAACLNQSYPVAAVIVVDDGSPEQIELPRCTVDTRVRVVRLPQNRGIAAARNAAIALSIAPYIACVNTEVLPDPDWLRVCLDYLLGHPRVGACFTRIVPKDPSKILTRWRMRFQELKFPLSSGPASFAPGHAVLFRREAIESVGGYDERFHHIMEDSDICERMWKAGREIHYVAESQCISIQKDDLAELARKQLGRSGWTSPEDYSIGRLFLGQSKWLFVRLARNLAKGRVLFIPVDLAVWVCALWIALTQNLLYARADHVGKKRVRIPD